MLQASELVQRICFSHNHFSLWPQVLAQGGKVCFSHHHFSCCPRCWPKVTAVAGPRLLAQGACHTRPRRLGRQSSIHQTKKLDTEDEKKHSMVLFFCIFVNFHLSSHHGPKTKARARERPCLLRSLDLWVISAPPVYIIFCYSLLLCMANGGGHQA